MTLFSFWNLSDQFLVWGINVLLQVTLITVVALIMAAFLYRNPVVRYWLLCASLLLVLLSPAIASTMQWSGKGLLSISLIHKLAAPKTDTILTELPEQTPSSLDSLQPHSQREYTGQHNRDSTTAVDTQDTIEVDSLKGQLQTESLLEQTSPPEETAVTSLIAQSTATGINQILRNAMTTLLTVWLSGSLFLLIRFCFGWRRLTIILRSAKPVTVDSLTELYKQVGQTLQITRMPELAVSKHVSAPISAGLFRPLVILPEHIIEQIAPEQLREILIHEVAHIVRRDQVILLMQNLTAVFFWLHPLITIVNRQLAQAREEVCDNYVLASTDAASYSHTLLTLAELTHAEQLLTGTIGLFTSRWKLEHRIAGLLDEKRSRLIHLSRHGMVFILALSLVMTTAIAFGTITLAVTQTKPQNKKFTNQKKRSEPLKPKPATQANTTTIRGTITGPDGKPTAGAQVAVLGIKDKNGWNPTRVLLGEGTTDSAGRYELLLQGFSSKTHSHSNLIARTKQSGIAWRPVNLDENQIHVDLKLEPEQIIQIRLVDPEGQPAARLPLELTNILVANKNGNPFESALGNGNLNSKSKIWPASIKTNEQGLFKLANIAPDHGAFLKIPGTEKFAPQSLLLNSGMPEERGKHDGTYRCLIKNIKPGEIATVVLAPAQFFEGTVLLGDSGKPAANARITMWASQQEPFGSMVSIEGKTDDAGRFRLNPYPGIRFGIIAYPPKGTPYLIRELKDLRWSPGTASKNIEIKLGKVVLAQGTVVDAKTGKPLQGASVQYYPVKANNKNLTDDIITGWQGIQKTDDAGKFQIPVLPGPGTLLVHAAERNYILQEVGLRELNWGKPGGARTYAHAFQKINPTTGKKLEPMKIELQPGATVSGTLVDEQGSPIKHALVISRLKISPSSPEWREYSDEANNGKFKLQGLREGEEYPVFFLDPKNRLGAKAMISTKTPSPRIVLKPCGSATARYVDPNGKPIADVMLGGLKLVVTPGKPQYDFQATQRGEKLADEALVANINRFNYRSPSTYTTNANGEMAFPALIPGAPYRHGIIVDGQPKITHEFTVQPGERYEMGDIEVKLD